MTTEKKEALIASIGFSDSQSGDGNASASYNVLKPVLRVNFMMLLVLRGRYGLRVRSCIRAFELSAGFALALLDFDRLTDRSS
jgi:hypothetical protein